jgi:hypothetical protein
MKYILFHEDYMKKNILVLLCLLIVGSISLLSVHPKFGERPYPADNLTNSARADSAHGFDVTKYEITLAVNDQTHFISGFVQANVTAGEQFNGIDYNLVGLTVSEVRVNDAITPYTHTNGILHINYTASAGQQLVTKVTYSGTPQLTTDVYHIGVIFSSATVFTLSDPDAGRYWWPSYDHPWDKAIVDLHITMRSDWLVACNGLRSSIIDNGNNTKTHNWLGSNPMATYLVCFTAGPYLEINQTAGTLPIQNFVTQAQYNNAMTDFSTLPSILQFYETQFGTYPFEKYGNAVVSMTTYGAMEHQTMTTLGQQYITGNHSGELTIAHELAHMWYGDCLTPLTYKDVWLSEGFATYSEFLWMHHRDGWQSAVNYMNLYIQQYYMNWENGNSPQVIYNPAYNNYFNPQSYEKSASVLHMLRLKIGNADFFQLLRSWFTTYHNSNVITSEFQALAEQISGQDLEQFFQQWIYSAGIPSVEYSIFSNQSLGRAKIVAKTTSSTTTNFDLEIPIATSSAPADSIIINANASGYINDFMISPDADLSTLTWDPKHWVLVRNHTVNQLQLVQCLGSNGSVLLNWNAFTTINPLAGYNIWRKLSTDTNWTMVNDNPASGLSYTDNNVTNGTAYQYRITAADISGYQSLPSNILTATPLSFPFDWGMLVVDETKDGNGNALTPNDAMVDSFYAAALAPISYTNWDYATMGAPTLNTLSHYPLILWHADDFSQNLIGDNMNALSSYLLGGGKLVISGWKTLGSLSTAFLNLYMPNVALNYHNGNVLISAQSEMYPVLTPDASKLTQSWNGIMPMIYTFNSNDSLYTANLVATEPGQGQTIAARFENDGTLIVFGFPLYFMQGDGVRTLLHQLVQELAPNLPAEDNSVSKVELNFSCYPNPVSHVLNLVSNQKFKSGSKFKIFNNKGQQVCTINPVSNKANAYSLNWTPVDEQGHSLPNGIYLVHYTDGATQITKKVIIMR